MTGTLLTLAPRALELPLLLRIALDSEQIGATVLQLAADQPDPVGAVAALRQHTRLVIVADPGGPADLVSAATSAGFDLLDDRRAALRELVLTEGSSDAALVADLAATIRDATVPVSVRCHGPRALTGMLAALGAGGHVRVGTVGDPTARDRDDVTLLARAAGIARLAGRPALPIDRARALLGLPTTPVSA